MKFDFSGKIYSNKPIKKEFYINNQEEDVFINVDVSTKLECLFFMWIIDPKGVLRVQHLFKNYPEKIIISSENCTRGVYPGEIINGTWSIILFTEKNLNEEKSIEYTLELKDFKDEEDGVKNNYNEEYWVDYKKEKGRFTLNNYKWKRKISSDKRWYRGDFHTHSNLSDGRMDEQMYMKTAKSMNLDFVVPTEHNILPPGWIHDENKVLVIPGTEVTLEDGHFNIFGLYKFPSVYNGESYEDMVINILKNQYKDKKSICSINHPMLEFWKWKFYNVELKYINTLEICNDPTYYLAKESNDAAIKLLDLLWNDGYKIYGVGGSDSHIMPHETYDNSDDPSIIGDPCTYVYSDGLSAHGILSSIKKGNIYVARGLELDIEIRSDKEKYLPGNEIKINSKKTVIDYKIKVKDIYWQNLTGKISAQKQDLKVCFIENGDIVYEKIIDNNEIIFKSEWRKDEYKYLRAEIRTLNNEFRAYINPVYHSKKKHELKTFKDLYNVYEIFRKCIED